MKVVLRTILSLLSFGIAWTGSSTRFSPLPPVRLFWNVFATHILIYAHDQYKEDVGKFKQHLRAEYLYTKGNTGFNPITGQAMVMEAPAKYPLSPDEKHLKA
jgi:hypothetical protein